MLNVVFNIPYNVAVGSSLAMILGTSVVATLRHGKLGNVDYKLGILMIVGAAIGIEAGAALLQLLKEMGSIVVAGRPLAAMDFYLSLAYILLLLSIGTMMYGESRVARKNNPGKGSVDSALIRRIHNISFPPIVALPQSEIASLSFWVILTLAFSIGLLVGFMGVGGGFILMPAFIYFLGIPTNIAVGTSLFQIIFSAGFGTFTHAIKGNIDMVLVIMLLLGSIIGAQSGALATKKIPAAQIRYYFSIIVYISALLVASKLLAKLEII